MEAAIRLQPPLCLYEKLYLVLLVATFGYFRANLGILVVFWWDFCGKSE